MATILIRKMFKAHSTPSNELRNFQVKVRRCALLAPQPPYISFRKSFQEEEDRIKVVSDMRVYENFVTETEEDSLMDELEPQLTKLRYERDHWDNVIKGFRETEKMKWRSNNMAIIERVKKVAFKKESIPLKYVHVLDLEESGFIKPHIDNIKFCGETIAGISLLSDSVMRLVHEKDKSKIVDVFLKRRSLYVMTGCARYDFTHEILGSTKSKFNNQLVKRTRRISIICRVEP